MQTERKPRKFIIYLTSLQGDFIKNYAKERKTTISNAFRLIISREMTKYDFANEI